MIYGASYMLTAGCANSGHQYDREPTSLCTMNPELRQTLNTISRNFESANEVAQENIYTFTQLIIDPCVSGFKTCIADCTSLCFSNRDDRLRRRRARSRGRSDLHFDFYDDWDDEEDDLYAPRSWGNDELDGLLAGRSSRSSQPARQRAMSYGTKSRRPAHAPGEDDPNIIPSSSYLGFLERFKWRPGARGLRYKPSAADLQDHPGALSRQDEREPLIEDNSEDEHMASTNKHKRQRSDTQASNSTSNSLSSRADLIMGDEEDDAVPLDDGFAVMLSKQNTNSSRRPGASRKSTRTGSSRSNKSVPPKRSGSSKSLQPITASPTLGIPEAEPPSMAALRAEEDHLRREQEMEIAQKREVATQLAKDRGLHIDATQSSESLETKNPEQNSEGNGPLTVEQLSTRQSSISEIEQRLGPVSPISSTAEYGADNETEPFPSFPPTPAKEPENVGQSP